MKYFEWVSVKDSTPPPRFDVLVYCYGNVQVGFYEGNDKWSIDQAYDVDVTHWMALPEGPNEE